MGIEATCLFFGKLRVDDASNSPLCVNDLTQSCKRPVSEQGKEDQSTVTESSDTNQGGGPIIKRSRKISDLMTKVYVASAGTGGPAQSEENTTEQTGPSVKATKGDDAEVNERQWDVWSVDSFRSGGGKSAKVYIAGTYLSELHGKLFRGLHRLAMLWYQKRILRSFLSYLNIQYGGGVNCSETIRINQGPKIITVPSWVNARYQMKSIGRSRKRKPQLAEGFRELNKDLLVGREAVWRATQASW